MQNERARQFLPFDALKGLKEALSQQELIVENRKNLSEDTFEYLSKIIKNVSIGNKLKVTYYYDIEYVETIGTLMKIDNKKMLLNNSIIFFEDIVDIKIL